jgi:hypothetical protein
MDGWVDEWTDEKIDMNRQIQIREEGVWRFNSDNHQNVCPLDQKTRGGEQLE